MTAPTTARTRFEMEFIGPWTMCDPDDFNPLMTAIQTGVSKRVLGPDAPGAGEQRSGGGAADPAIGPIVDADSVVLAASFMDPAPEGSEEPPLFASLIVLQFEDAQDAVASAGECVIADIPRDDGSVLAAYFAVDEMAWPELDDPVRFFRMTYVLTSPMSAFAPLIFVFVTPNLPRRAELMGVFDLMMGSVAVGSEQPTGTERVSGSVPTAPAAATKAGRR